MKRIFKVWNITTGHSSQQSRHEKKERRDEREFRCIPTIKSFQQQQLTHHTACFQQAKRSSISHKTHFHIAVTQWTWTVQFCTWFAQEMRSPTNFNVNPRQGAILSVTKLRPETISPIREWSGQYNSYHFWQVMLGKGCPCFSYTSAVPWIGRWTVLASISHSSFNDVR